MKVTGGVRIYTQFISIHIHLYTYTTNAHRHTHIHTNKREAERWMTSNEIWISLWSGHLKQAFNEIPTALFGVQD